MGLMKFYLSKSLEQLKNELHKIHVGPQASVGKCESNIFFAKCHESCIKKVRKVEEHKIWVRGRLGPFPDFAYSLHYKANLRILQLHHRNMLAFASCLWPWVAWVA